MTDETDTVPVFVVQTRQSKDNELAARGFGWPTNNETAESNEQFIEEMGKLEERIEVESHDPETKVAEFTVQRPDGEITDVEVLE